MKSKIFTIFALLSTFTLSFCGKDDGIDYKLLDIEVESSGGEYQFQSGAVEVLLAPDNYYAEVEGNTVIGKYAGTTTAQIKSDGVTYDCTITVTPSYTYYIDMALYMGWSKSAIEELFGEPVKVMDSVYAYNPLSEYFSENIVGFIYEDNKVTCAASYFSIYSGTSIIRHLSQRYVAFGVKDNVAYFGNGYELDDVTLMVSYNYSNTSYTYVMYLKYSGSAISLTKAVEAEYSADITKAFDDLPHNQ